MKANKPGKRSKRGFVMLRNDMQDSKAWRALSSNSRSLWFEVMRKYNGNNNGEIGLGCREAGNLCGFSKNTASRSFNELEEKGFIKIGNYSDFRLKTKKAREWIVTHEKMGRKMPTNEWRKFELDKI